MSKKRVLLVEDDPDTRHIYSTMMRAVGYDVIEAKDGGEGVMLAHMHKPDVVVMNLVMPRVDGISASALIRDNPATATIPIIVCTAFMKSEGEDMAEDAGCNVYLEKPCSPSRLLSEVARFIGEPDGTPVAAGGDGVRG